MEKIKIMMKLLKFFIPFLRSFIKTISLWANLLAIFAVLTLTGLINIKVKPSIHILKPTYVIQKDYIRAELNRFKYPLADSITNMIFKTNNTIIVDIPYNNVLFNTVTGEVFKGKLKRKSNNGFDFSYKELTDGSKIFRSMNFGYNPRDELKGNNTTDTIVENITAPISILEPYEKRMLLMPFFTSYIVNTYKADWVFLSTDSILKIEDKFLAIKTDPPPFLSSAIFDTRIVFSILSIENSGKYDIKDIQIGISKKYIYKKYDKLKLEAWTIGSSYIDFQRNTGSEILINIPKLKAYGDIQLIISSLSAQLKEEDITVSYENFKNLNTGTIWLIILLTLFLSMICSFAIEFKKS